MAFTLFVVFMAAGIAAAVSALLWAFTDYSFPGTAAIVFAIIAVVAAISAEAFTRMDSTNRTEQRKEACFRADGYWHSGSCFPEPSIAPWETDS